MEHTTADTAITSFDTAEGEAPTPESASLTPAIRVRGLSKSYGDKQVLTGLDLTVAAGTTLALLGPNGAGKTTTVEILQGLRRRDSGTVSVLDLDPAVSSPAWRARLGVVSQASTDLGELSVTEAVTHVSRFYADPSDVAATIERVGLTDDASTRAARLSGGRRRRLDVALAIVGRPDLLFLDEPTTGFDPEARRAFWDLISDLQAGGTTVILTTHYLDEAAHLADQVAVILGGQVVEQGTVDEFRRTGSQERTVRWSEAGQARSLTTDRPTALVASLTARLARDGGEVPDLQVLAPTLEDRYLAQVTAHDAAHRPGDEGAGNTATPARPTADDEVRLGAVPAVR